MTIIEQVEKELKIYEWRGYLDCYSFEYKSSTLPQKVEVFRKLITSKYSIHDIVNEYRDDYSSSKYKHIRDCIKETLIYICAYIETGKTYSSKMLKELKPMAEYEVIDYLINLLNPNFKMDDIFNYKNEFKRARGITEI